MGFEERRKREEKKREKEKEEFGFGFWLRLVFFFFLLVVFSGFALSFARSLIAGHARACFEARRGAMRVGEGVFFLFLLRFDAALSTLDDDADIVVVDDDGEKKKKQRDME